MHQDVYVSFCIVVLFYRVSGYTFTFTSYFMSDYHNKTKTKTKHFPQIILLHSSHKKGFVGKIKTYVSEWQNSKRHLKYLDWISASRHNI